MRKKNTVRWQKSLVAAGILIFLIAAASVLVTRWVQYMEEEKGFEQLREETRAMAEEIETHAANDREQLEILAEIISGYDDMSSPELWGIIDSYTTTGMISRFEILLPDDTVLTEGGQAVDAQGELSFEEESAKGSHITDRQMDLERSDDYILRHYVPIVRDNSTVAMLYGVVELDGLSDKLINHPFGGKAAVYLLDGNTGDFFVDTWHNEPGNIWELGERKMAPGYDHEQLQKGMIEGKTGYVVFVSETIGEHLYFYYEPVGINNWRIALSVPEDVVFESARLFENVLNAFLIFECVCFVCYFLWMIHYIRLETSKKQHQLDTISYIYDVEKLLFSAHEDQENIKDALARIGQMTGAENVVFWMQGHGLPEGPLQWEDQRGRSGGIDFFNDRKYTLFDYFRQENDQISLCTREKIVSFFGNGDMGDIRNMTAVSIKDIDESVCGVLAVFNMNALYGNPALLKNVSISFSMFCQNLRSFASIKEQGEKDILSGLYNRNRYEMDLPKIAEECGDSLACVYIDVNGLHELNNTEGHEAGDRMIQTVAEELKRRFGGQYTYRIGGDEFLAFAPDWEKDYVERQTGEMMEDLKKKRINISAGIQWEQKTDSVEILVKEAERKMYEAKREYYEQAVNDRRKRNRRVSS